MLRIIFFLMLTKKTGRAPCIFGCPAGLFCTRDAVWAGIISLGPQAICPFFAPEKADNAACKRPARRSFLQEIPRKIYRRHKRPLRGMSPEKRTFLISVGKKKPGSAVHVVNGAAWLHYDMWIFITEMGRGRPDTL